MLGAASDTKPGGESPYQELFYSTSSEEADRTVSFAEFHRSDSDYTNGAIGKMKLDDGSASMDEVHRGML